MGVPCVVAGLLLVTAALPAQTRSAGADGAGLSYALSIGDMLRVKGAWESKTSWGSQKTTYDWVLWVVGVNKDGSFRIAFRRNEEREVTKKKVTTRRGTYHRLGWVELRADGTFPSNPSIDAHQDACLLVSLLFVPLPRTKKERTEGWSRTVLYDRRYQCKLKPGTRRSTAIDIQVDSMARRMFDSEEHIHAEVEKGLPKRVIATLESKWKNARSSTKIALELESRGKFSDDAPQQLYRDVVTYYRAREAYERAMVGHPRPEEVKKAAAKAWEALLAAAKRTEVLEVRKLFEEFLKYHQNFVRRAERQSKLFSRLLGNPSPEWTATNLDGETRSLKDYRGKVVLMCFWRRGRTWSARTLSQIESLFDHYKGKPVAILGFGKNVNAEDVHWMVDKGGLKHETFHPGWKISLLYGINRDPATVVIDAKSAVCDVRLDYATTREQELMKVIDGLLGQR